MNLVPSTLPTIALAPVIANATEVVEFLFPWVGVALAFTFGPRLLKTGVAMIAGRRRAARRAKHTMGDGWGDDMYAGTRDHY